MTIKEQIIKDLTDITHPKILYQIFDFINIIKRNVPELKSNKDKVLSLAGSLTDDDAREVIGGVDEEFNHIEGDW